MADINIRTTRVACNTSTGDQDITIASFGTPKAAMIIVQEATADATSSAPLSICVGFYDGTNSVSAATNSRNSNSTQYTASWNDTLFVSGFEGTGITPSYKASVSFITDGIRLNWTDAPASAWLATVVLYGGTDLSAHVGYTSLNSAGTTNITGVGFRPNLVHTLGVQGTAMPTSPFQLSGRFNMGLAYDNGTTLKQSSIFKYETHNVATTESSGTTSDTYIFQGSVNDTSIQYSASLSNFNSDGFDIPAGNGAYTGLYLLHMSLEFAGSPSVTFSQFDGPTSTGSVTTPSLSFSPAFAQYFISANTALDTPQTGNLSTSIFTADSSNSYSTSISAKDNVGTTETRNITSSGALTTLKDGNTTNLDGTFTGFTGSGPQFNFSTVPASGERWFGYAINYSANYSLSLDSGSYTETGTDVGFDRTRLVKSDSGSYALAGTDINFTAGKIVVASSGTYSLTGTDVGLSRSIIGPIDSGSYALTGTDTNLEYHVVEPFASGSYTLTGSSLGTYYNKALAVDSGSFTLTGTDVVIRLANKVQLDTGSYLLTGTDAGLLATRKLAIDSGSYSLSGTAVDLRRSYPLAVDSGSYTLSGTATSLLKQSLVSSVSGSYVLTGSSVAFQGNVSLPIDTDSYLVSGTSVNLTVSRITSVDSDSYTLTGTDVNFGLGLSMTATSGSYNLTGTATTLSRSFDLALASGVYTLTGTDVALSYPQSISSDSGSYTLTGSAVSFVYSGAPTLDAFGERLILVSSENRIINVI